jgi:DNA polymerase I-like protein with 3'-5' exonuclease and polymerase domains
LKCRIEEVEVVSELVGRLMADAPAQKLGLKVPLGVDVGTGANWNDTKGAAE